MTLGKGIIYLKKQNKQVDEEEAEWAQGPASSLLHWPGEGGSSGLNSQLLPLGSLVIEQA